MPVYTAPAPPPLPQYATQPYALLQQSQEEMYQNVLAHFSKEYYTLPGAEEGKGGLMEEEKFWLVSFVYCPRVRNVAHYSLKFWLSAVMLTVFC